MRFIRDFTFDFQPYYPNVNIQKSEPCFGFLKNLFLEPLFFSQREAPKISQNRMSAVEAPVRHRSCLAVLYLKLKETQSLPNPSVSKGLALLGNLRECNISVNTSTLFVFGLIFG